MAESKLDQNELNYHFSYAILKQLLKKEHITKQQFELAVIEVKNLYLTT